MHGWRFYRRLNRLARLLRLDLVVLRHKSLFAEIRCADFWVDQWRAKKTPRNACKVHLPRYPGRGSLTVSLQRKHDSLSVRIARCTTAVLRIHRPVALSLRASMSSLCTRQEGVRARHDGPHQQCPLLPRAAASACED